MDLNKLFDIAFNTQCILTNHAINRIKERFLYSELEQLKLLVQASIKNSPLNKWENDRTVVLIDPRYNMSILCSYHKEENIVKVITFIRGKTPEAYKDCDKIVVSILKEKAEQEVAILNSYRKNQKKNNVIIKSIKK